MKTKLILISLVLGASLGAPLSLRAHEGHDHAKPEAPAAQASGRLDEPTEKDEAWLAKARATYPLRNCPVSGDALDSMGEVIERIYRREGQTDRLVRFCCDSCIDDFKKDPAKFLKAIDEAGKPAVPPKS